MKLIKGENLTPSQLAQVKAAFVNRFSAIGEGKHYPTDQAWIVDHAFYFSKQGQLSQRHKHCEPYYMADDFEKFAAGYLRNIPNGAK